jgi:hypothetical protein
MRNDTTTSPEYDRFNRTMKKVLKMSKKELDKRLAAEKKSKTSVSRVPASSH